MNKPNIHIVKIGGKVLSDSSLLKQAIQKFTKLEGKKLLIHGGGNIASQWLSKIGINPKMINGRRITDAASLEVIAMVYAGKLNKEIVAQLQAHNCNAIGLSGADGNIIQADKRAVKEIDYGFAGDISKVNVPLLQQLFKLGLSPVICSLTHDKKGQLLNTNADTISNTIASSLSDKYKVNLYYLFELEGVLKNKNDQTSKINSINSNEFHKLIELKKISDGMIPKLHNAFEAIQKGVHQISIGNPSILDNPINGTMLKQM